MMVSAWVCAHQTENSRRPPQGETFASPDKCASSPQDVKASYPKASILKAGRVVFNIKGNDYRLIAAIQYQAGVLAVRFFGSQAEYDRIDAETMGWMRL